MFTLFILSIVCIWHILNTVHCTCHSLTCSTQGTLCIYSTQCSLFSHSHKVIQSAHWTHIAQCFLHTCHSLNFCTNSADCRCCTAWVTPCPTAQTSANPISTDCWAAHCTFSESTKAHFCKTLFRLYPGSALLPCFHPMIKFDRIETGCRSCSDSYKTSFHAQHSEEMKSTIWAWHMLLVLPVLLVLLLLVLLLVLVLVQVLVYPL